ncbi:flightin [Phymastichus coffea]|uniref:flightin n=1 Tax=Phymastichus coffea TaxID=108790 RepID=UPI00273C62C8|nr:flightin [Phymastichus coffea]XP_058797391.1 flightin [Phymastichus coffea]
MWDDEPSPWDVDETPAAAGDEAAAAGGEAGAPAAAAAAPEAGFDWRTMPKADPPKYTYHWVRPLFLNYGYIYDYRQNYYNDVIDWMNKRNKGLSREEPRAEEWPERALRMYDSKNVTNRSYKRCSDMRILTGYKPKIRHYSYHTRAYYSLRYQKIL